MKRFLHISIVWGGTAKFNDQLKPILDLADDWYCYGGFNWILYTAEDIFIWQGRFIAVIDTARDKLFICEISNAHVTAGWLSEAVRQWLRKARLDESPYGFLLPPGFK